MHTNRTYTLSPEVLNDIIKYIEKTEVTIDGEWGDGRTLEELIADKEMPKLYHDLIDLKMKEFSTTNVKFHVSGNSWVMDCPALKIKGLPLCPARYPKVYPACDCPQLLDRSFLGVLAYITPRFRGSRIEVKQEARRQEAYASILAELSEAYSDIDSERLFKSIYYDTSTKVRKVCNRLSRQNRKADSC